MNKRPRNLPPGVATDARGASQLVIDAVHGVTDLVEKMHRNIASVSPIVGKGPEGGARGISGLVYRSIRGITRVVGLGLDTALAPFTPLLGRKNSPQREAVLAAINGIFGDHLWATHNPLAITMQLRQQGEALVLQRASGKAQGGRLLVLVHGLCMNDVQWTREGHDHGALLAQDLGYTALYLHYNTGRHIGSNGREFDAVLTQLVQSWPVPVTELVIVGHSMGGLVARSACYWADQAEKATKDGAGWRRHLTKLVCLGTPHHGAPLERAGSWVDVLVGISPYTAPFARLANVRSAGIKDLRHGDILVEDEPLGDGDAAVDTGLNIAPSASVDTRESASTSAAMKVVPLPQGVQCYAIAATTSKVEASPTERQPRGDGLVPVRSALGEHKDPALSLHVPPEQQKLFYGLNHFDLLGSPAVGAQLKAWLA